MTENWSDDDLATLTALDLELPHADTNLLALKERLRALLNDDALAKIEDGVRIALQTLRDHQPGDLAAGIDRFAQSMRDSYPAGTSPAVKALTYQLVGRLFEVGANIASSAGPLPPRS